MAEQQDHLGQHIGEYRLLHQLGKGSFGAVYLAEHLHHHSQAAIKLLRFHLTSPKDFKEFLNEARTIRLRHQHIVPLLDFGLTRDNTPYLVMEYAAGGTLQQRCPKGTKLPFQTIDSYVTQLASALQYAHDHRVIHRDVKPGNVLLRADGTLWLSDFGIAKVLEQSSFVSLQTQVGTPAYMAPEQSRGKPCSASDQYSLAVMVYEWLAGRLPFQGAPLEVMLQHRVDEPPSLQEWCPEVSIQVEQVILQALKKTPEERFSTVEQFAQTWHAALQVSSSMDFRMQPCNELGSVPPLITASPSPIQPSPSPEPSITHDPVILSPSPPMTQDPITLSVSPPEMSSASASFGGMQTPFPPHLAPSRKMRAIPEGQQVELPFQPPLVGDEALFSQGSSARSSLLMPAHTATVVPRSRKKRHAARTLLVTLLCSALLVSLAGGIWTFLMQQHSAYDIAIATSGIQFGFDAQHTRSNPYERILSPSNAKRLVRAWTAQTGGGVQSPPAVANGVIYVGSDDRKLYAFKADGCGQATCAPLWTAQTGSRVDSSPAVANGVVYVGSDDDKLYAFKAEGCGQTSCAPLWTAQTGSWVESSPAVANGVVYVGSEDDKLYAFNANGCGQASCAPLWTAQTGREVTSSPAVANGVVYVGSRDGKLYAFHL